MKSGLDCSMTFYLVSFISVCLNFLLSPLPSRESEFKCSIRPWCSPSLSCLLASSKLPLTRRILFGRYSFKCFIARTIISCLMLSAVHPLFLIILKHLLQQWPGLLAHQNIGLYGSFVYVCFSFPVFIDFMMEVFWFFVLANYIYD